jgi:hypothetical protein
MTAQFKINADERQTAPIAVNAHNGGNGNGHGSHSEDNGGRQTGTPELTLVGKN